MKSSALLPVVFFAFFCSACNFNPAKDTPKTKTEIPEPLKDEQSGFGLKKSGLRDGSLMNDIYNDLAKKDPELRNLEDQLQHFYGDLPDSLKEFNNYDAKTDSYYSSANGSLSSIKDTVLRARLSTLIAESKSKYLDKISRFSNLIRHIDSNEVKIEDYHAVLKIAATLPVIEKYQDESMPNIKSTANAANEAQRLKAKTLQLSKKYLPKVKGVN